ncbi:MAG: HAD family hydrolase [Actinobacteria bacterium]|nr:HAD family hydrolase [Actinomycetota bacterium]NCA26199.1 HAD family hydrolase [Actinomycetota bacterium]NCU96775.1 HAD family hydrolase [Actinomycetota bacterium]NDD78566.1 HAD family hydrolase [Actinomycetota bacterium]
MSVEMVAFDVAGTVLNDDGLVISAFRNAFEATQPDLWPTHGEQWTQYAIDTMGQSKIHVFTELLGDAEKAHQANLAFEESYVSEIAEVGAVPIAGAEELFKYLRAKGIAVALTTGFSRSTLDTLLIELGWKDLIDLSITPSEAGRGRPHPDMLNMAVEVLGITNSANVIVCGDTAADMQAAVAFGAGQVIGVLTGAHNEQTLHDAGATSVINSIADLKSLI